MSAVDLVTEVIAACSAKVLPTDVLPNIFYDKMKQGGSGVAQTFFGVTGASAPITLHGPSGELDATGVITTAAVLHISKSLSQCENISGFDKCIDRSKAAAASDSHLGVRQLASVSRVAVKLDSFEQLAMYHALPQLPTIELAQSWTPGAAPTQSPSQWLATALLDDWVHTNVLQNINVEGSTGWQALQKTSGFVESMREYLVNGPNRMNLINTAIHSAGGTRFPLQLLIYILVRIAPDADTYNVVASNLTTTTREMAAKDPKTELLEQLGRFYSEFMGLVQGTIINYKFIDRIAEDPFKNSVVAAASVLDVSHTGGEPLPSSAADAPMPIFAPVSTDSTYGQALQNWINQDNGPKQFGLTSGAAPNNHAHEEHEGGGGGCFLPGTLVLLADGTSLPIEQIKEGMQVLTRNACNVRDWSHAHGTVSSERVEVVSAYTFPTFGFNSDEPFFTAEHVFFTTTGLRAINPAAAVRQNPWLKVGPLRLHDVVKRATKEGRYELVPICSFTYAQATGSVHGLHLREGMRSYHANGYLVALNYPELTGDRLLTGLKSLPLTLQLRFIEDMQAAQHSMGHAVGDFLPQAIREVIKNATSHEAILSEKFQPEAPPRHGLQPRPMHHLHSSFTLTPPDNHVHPAEPPRHVSITRGHVFVDGELVTSARLTRDQAHWTRALPRSAGSPQAMFEHGSLQLHAHRRTGFGTLGITDSLSPTATLIAAPLAVTADADVFKYSTKVSAKPVKPDDWIDDDSTNLDLSTINDWIDGPDFLYGNGAENCSLGVAAIDNTTPVHMDMSIEVVRQSSQEQHVNAVAQAEALRMDMAHPYKRYQIRFGFDTLHFTGFVVKYDEKGNDFEGEQYYFKGTYVSDVEDHLTAQNLAHSLVAMPEEDLVQTAPHDLTKNLIKDNPVLSVENLYAIPMPENPQTAAIGLLKMAMLYHIPEDWRLNFFKVKAPDPEGDKLNMKGVNLINISKEEKEFLVNRFAVAYLSQLMSRSSDLEKHFSSDDLQKLSYFLKGSAVDGCMSSDPSYTTLNNIAQALAFTKYTTDVLDPYLAGDDESRRKWASDLYEYYTGPGPAWRIFKNTVMASRGHEEAQRVAMILYCLSPDDGHRYDLKLWHKLQTTVPMQACRPFFQYSAPEKESPISYPEFDEVFRALVIRLFNNNDTADDSVPANIAADAQALVITFGNKSAEDKAKILEDDLQELRKDFLGFMQQARGPIWQKMRDWLNSATASSKFKTWAKAKLFRAAKLLGVAMHCYSLVMSIFSLATGFEKMSIQTRASLITSCISSGLEGLNEVGIEGVKKLVGIEVDPVVLAAAERSMAAADAALLNGTAVGEEELMGLKFMWDGPFAGALKFGSEKAANNLVKFFAAGGKFLRVVGALAMCAAAVESGFDIKKDFDTDSGASDLQKSMDIMSIIGSGIVVLGEMATVVGEMATMLTLETIGAALGPIGAVIGVAALVVGLFIHGDPPDPPPSPAEVFVRDQTRAFLDTVSTQPYPDPVKSVMAELNADGKTATLTIEPPVYHGTTSIASYCVAALEVGHGAELMSSVPTQVFVVAHASSAATTTTVTMIGLKPGKVYTFNVTPNNADKDSKANYAQFSRTSNNVRVPSAAP